MASRKKFYEIQVPCKPYIRKFAVSLYGETIHADSSTTLGLIITHSLEKNYYTTRHLTEVKRAEFLRERPCNISIKINKWQFEAIGHDIKGGTHLTINRFLETLFDENLYLHVSCRLKEDKEMKGYKDAIIEFAEKHCLVLFPDIGEKEDITYEGLKKKEYRFRKKKQNIA